ncbi:MAG TPA: DUF1801 domain-containing protein [Bacteroidales bacterium]|nr:DUF1801 domain-containing protein [Bacteroidales bacterium]
MDNFKTVDEYIGSFPGNIQTLLNQMRDTVRSIAPDAEEGISYGMPAYRLNKRPLVYFAGFKNHIGFYATPTGHAEFAAELAVYKQGKGSVQFPIDEPLPLELIRRIIAFRVMENLAKV